LKSTRWLGESLYRVLPKRRVAVFNGQPDFCDDVLALESVLRDVGLRKLVVLCRTRAGAKARSNYPALSPKTVAVPKWTLRGVWYAMTSKYVFFTHSWATLRFPDSVESVNVWHGMPVKRVGWMTESGPMVPVVKYSLATSPFWQAVVQESLRPTVSTLVTGLPRNDRLVLGDRGVTKALGHSLESGARVIVWLPTYRGTWTGVNMRTHCAHVLGLTADQLRGVNDLLEQQNALLVIKRHPLAEGVKAPELSRTAYITDDWLRDRGFTLHELLGESCVLVTDVSSAYVDYLLLDRPIVHHFPDIDEYGHSRGYSFEPIQDYLAGPVVDDPDGLAGALSEILQGKDTHAEQRRHVRELFHEPLGGSSAERVVKALGLVPTKGTGS
jgi:CDP-glycerol glycerophosphotransferase